MARVILDQLRKSFDQQEIVKGISLDIHDGEFVVFVGPSGCGKTTVLRMIAGLETPTQGKIQIGDSVVNDIPPKDRDIAMVFQNYALYPHMNVFDNLSFGLKMRQMPKNEINTRVQTVAQTLGLSELLQRKPKQLSGGQRQRVALGRAIVRNPKVFLMDEPLSNLDAKLRVQMRLEITELHQRLKTTTLYVTHDQVEAMTMGQRIVVFHQGVIQQVDVPLTIYNQPANLFVAGFMGQMNCLQTDLSAANQVGSQAGSIEIQAVQDDRASVFSIPLPATGNITMAIRPEHVLLNPSQADSLAVSVMPQRIETLGSETWIHGHWSVCGQSQPVLWRVPSEVNPTVGERFHFWIEARHLLWFDTNTGLRIR
ncbi:MAG: sn-glycerol-3-phosphate ABC transporter ATP-binding protein UgpC [Cyanobacteria bacterium]|nr:sn-glycerol-3-phosphate ABC transporter ATP-binding protein UgpC [Cyanobacteriota bacterium]